MKFIHILTGIFSLLLLAGNAWGKGDMGPFLKSGEIWTTDYDTYEVWGGERIAWVEKDKKMRFVKPLFTIGEQKLGETLVEFEGKKPVQIVISVYNRGDNGALGKKEFEALEESVKAAVDDTLDVEGDVYKPSRAKTAVKIEGYLWKTDKTTVLL